MEYLPSLRASVYDRRGFEKVTGNFSAHCFHICTVFILLSVRSHSIRWTLVMFMASLNEGNLEHVPFDLPFFSALLWSILLNSPISGNNNDIDFYFWSHVTPLVIYQWKCHVDSLFSSSLTPHYDTLKQDEELSFFCALAEYIYFWYLQSFFSRN